jgi:ADP-Ribosyltransferase in polyvalent proteins
MSNEIGAAGAWADSAVAEDAWSSVPMSEITWSDVSVAPEKMTTVEVASSASSDDTSTVSVDKSLLADAGTGTQASGNNANSSNSFGTPLFNIDFSSTDAPFSPSPGSFSSTEATGALTLSQALSVLQDPPPTPTPTQQTSNTPETKNVEIVAGMTALPNLEAGKPQASAGGGASGGASGNSSAVNDAKKMLEGLPAATNKVANEIAKKTAPPLITYPALRDTSNDKGKLNPETGKLNGVIASAPMATAPVGPDVSQETKNNLKGVLPGNGNWDKLNDPRQNGTGQVKALEEQLKKVESQTFERTNNNINATITAFNEIGTTTQSNQDEFAQLLAQRPVAIPVGAAKGPMPGSMPISDPAVDKIKNASTKTANVNKVAKAATESSELDHGDLRPSGIGAAANDFATKLQNSDQLVNKLIDPTGLTRLGTGIVIRGVGDVLNNAENALTGAANGGLTVESSVESIAKVPLNVLGTGNAIFGNNPYTERTLNNAGRAVSESLNPNASDAERLFTDGSSKLGAEWLIGEGTNKLIGAVTPVMGSAFNKLFKSTDDVGTQAANSNAVGRAPLPPTVAKANFENWFGKGQNQGQANYIRTDAEKNLGREIANPGYDRVGTIFKNEPPQPYAKVDITRADNPPSSYVLNPDGTPMTFYHGTVSDFNQFEVRPGAGYGGQLGRGSYFSSDPKIANRYAEYASENAKAMAELGGDPPLATRESVMPVYVTLKKPYVMDSRQIDNPFETPAMTNDHRLSEQFTQVLKNQGYDGVVFVDKHGARQVNVFNTTKSTNIKSIYNDGRWDPKNPDIRSAIPSTGSVAA